jgi:hypothetical protein
MKQLVLQWSSNDISEYNRLLLIEKIIVESLPDNCEVDGHDIGSGEMNVFILTERPKYVFDQLKSVLESEHLLIGVRAAYREDDDSSDYTVLWPTDLHKFSVA